MNLTQPNQTTNEESTVFELVTKAKDNYESILKAMDELIVATKETKAIFEEFRREKK